LTDLAIICDKIDEFKWSVEDLAYHVKFDRFLTTTKSLDYDY